MHIISIYIFILIEPIVCRVSNEKKITWPPSPCFAATKRRALGISVHAWGGITSWSLVKNSRNCWMFEVL